MSESQQKYDFSTDTFLLNIFLKEKQQGNKLLPHLKLIEVYYKEISFGWQCMHFPLQDSTKFGTALKLRNLAYIFLNLNTLPNQYEKFLHMGKRCVQYTTAVERNFSY